MWNYLFKRLKLTNWAQKWLGVSMEKQVLRNGLFFESLFAKSKHALNLSTGVVQGRYRDSVYLLRMEPGQFIESHVLLEGSWEPHILDILQSFLRPNSTMFDIGANVGATVVPLAKTNLGCNFVCFEPHPQVFTKLEANIKLNKLDNVQALNVALSNMSVDSVDFYAQLMTDKNLGLSSLMMNKGLRNFDRIQIRNSSVDQVWDDHGQPDVSVIKVDTQGSELSILLSAGNLISRCQPIIVFEHESSLFTDRELEQKTRKDLIKFFEESNYELFFLQRKSRFMPKVTLTSQFNGDILALPRSCTN